MLTYKRFCPSFVALLAAAGLFPLAAAGAETDPVNIVFISVDDLNDWVGFLHGHPQAKTPNMDRLAARGVVFSNAHCAAPLCCPSRAAVYSGRQPFHTGVYDNGDDIRLVGPEVVLLPSHMRAHGYRTWGAGKLLHRPRPDLFDDFFKPEQRWSPFPSSKPLKYTPEELPSKGTEEPRHVVDMGDGRPPIILPLNRMPSDRKPDDPGAESFDWGPLDVPDRAMGDAQIVDWAIEHLRKDSTQPFFLALGFYRPHIPLWAPRPYFEPFKNRPIQLPPFLETDLDDLAPVARDIALTPRTAGAHGTVLRFHQWEAAVAAYLACVYFVDTQIGRLLDALEATGHDGDTAIVIWGDHGWHLGEKQHWGKWTGWQRATRVPLLIVPPRRHRERYAVGQSTQEPVSLIDLYPTVLHAAMLHSMDRNVAAIVAELETLGLIDSTILIFTSDNGAMEAGSSLPLRGHKHTIYDGGVRLPTVMHWPEGGLVGGWKWDGLCGSLDMFPTLMAMAGCTMPETRPLDGKNIWPALRDNKPSPVDSYYFVWRNEDAIRTPRWKLHRFFNRVELYDITKDENESTNVAGAHPDVVKRLVARMDAWAESLGVALSHQPAPARYHAPPAPEGDVLAVTVTITDEARPRDRLAIPVASWSGTQYATDWIVCQSGQPDVLGGASEAG